MLLHYHGLYHYRRFLTDEVSALYTDKDGDEVCSMIDFAMGWDYHAKKEWYESAIEVPFAHHSTLLILYFHIASIYLSIFIVKKYFFYVL